MPVGIRETSPSITPANVEPFDVQAFLAEVDRELEAQDKTAGETDPERNAGPE
jgi:hypothetical protein